MQRKLADMQAHFNDFPNKTGGGIYNFKFVFHGFNRFLILTSRVQMRAS